MQWLVHTPPVEDSTNLHSAIRDLPMPRVPKEAHPRRDWVARVTAPVLAPVGHRFAKRANSPPTVRVVLGGGVGERAIPQRLTAALLAIVLQTASWSGWHPGVRLAR